MHGQKAKRQNGPILRRTLTAGFCAGLIAGLLALSTGVASARSPRVASINLCADNALLALADPEQIVSLGPFARDAALSFQAEKARRFPMNGGHAEEIVRLKPDLVLVGRYDSRATRQLLARAGLRVFELPPWAGFEAGAAHLRALAAAIGQAARGDALIADIEAARHAAGQSTPRGLTALALGRGGYVDIAGNLTQTLIEAVGLHDATQSSGLSGGRYVPLEVLVAARPDVLIVGESDIWVGDQKAAFLGHRALAGSNAPARITLPIRLTACGGPSLPAALEFLSAEVRGLARRQNPRQDQDRHQVHQLNRGPHHVARTPP